MSLKTLVLRLWLHITCNQATKKKKTLYKCNCVILERKAASNVSEENSWEMFGEAVKQMHPILFYSPNTEEMQCFWFG